MIHYDAETQRWDHALERIAATRTADNVVALMLQWLRRSFIAGASALTATLALPRGSRAQADYPNRPVRVVAPFPPGQGTELIARAISILFASGSTANA